MDRTLSTKWVGASLWALVLLGAVTLQVLTAAAERQPYRSPFDLAFSPDGGTLAVSDRTAGRLYVLDAQAGKVAREIELRGQPTGVAWQAEGRVVVSEYDAGTANSSFTTAATASSTGSVVPPAIPTATPTA